MKSKLIELLKIAQLKRDESKTIEDEKERGDIANSIAEEINEFFK